MKLIRKIIFLTFFLVRAKIILQKFFYSDECGVFLCVGNLKFVLLSKKCNFNLKFNYFLMLRSFNSMYYANVLTPNVPFFRSCSNSATFFFQFHHRIVTIYSLINSLLRGAPHLEATKY